MEFTLPADVEDYRKRYRPFVAEHLIPLERDPNAYDEHENIRLQLLEELRAKAKSAGLWAPHCWFSLAVGASGMCSRWEVSGR